MLKLPAQEGTPAPVGGREERQGSFLTDKDPSYIQPNDATYSERGDFQAPQSTLENQNGQGAVAAACQSAMATQASGQIARSKTVTFAICKEFSFGGADR